MVLENSLKLLINILYEPYGYAYVILRNLVLAVIFHLVLFPAVNSSVEDVKLSINDDVGDKLTNYEIFFIADIPTSYVQPCRFAIAFSHERKVF